MKAKKSAKKIVTTPKKGMKAVKGIATRSNGGKKAPSITRTKKTGQVMKRKPVKGLSKKH